MTTQIRSIEVRASKLANKYSSTKISVDVKQVAKKLNIELRETSFKRNISGILYIEKGKGVIGYNKNESEVRQRFTIAHEIGHYLLHRLDREIFYEKEFKLYRNSKSSTGEEEMEREANAFAAALLMPKDRLQKEIEKIHFDFVSDKDEMLEKLAKSFKVSNQAMMYRILNLRLV